VLVAVVILVRDQADALERWQGRAELQPASTIAACS